MVEMIEHLIGRGYTLKVYDRSVSLASLQGTNRAYIEQEIPHVAALRARSTDEVLESSDVIVTGNKAAEFIDVLPRLRDGRKLAIQCAVSRHRLANDGHSMRAA